MLCKIMETLSLACSDGGGDDGGGGGGGVVVVVAVVAVVVVMMAVWTRGCGRGRGTLCVLSSCLCDVRRAVGGVCVRTRRWHGKVPYLDLSRQCQWPRTG